MVDDPSVTKCAFKLKTGVFCKNRATSGQRFCWQHSGGWKPRWRSLSRSQAAGFIATLVGTVVGIIGLALGVPPLWRMLFPPHPIAYVEVNDTLGRGNIHLLAAANTSLPFNKRDGVDEVLFYVRNEGNESLKKPIYAVLVSPSDICRVVVHPQFGINDVNGCHGVTGTTSMTPDLPYLGESKGRQKPLSEIGAKKNEVGPIASLSTDTDSFRQVAVKLTIPFGVSDFDVQFQISGQNLSFSNYNIHYRVLN